MRKIWQYYLDTSDDFMFNYNGSFISIGDNKLLFVYKRVSTVKFVEFDHCGNVTKCKEFVFEKVAIPAYWQVSKGNGYTLLHCGADIAFVINEDDILLAEDEDYEEVYSYDEYHLSADAFVFDNYRIEHAGSFGYSCTDMVTGKKLWKTRVQGYLYSDIVKIKDKILICTAGYGGFVYAIDLLTGEHLYQVKTHGTAKIEYSDNLFYCYILGKRGALVAVDIDSGDIIDRQELFRVTMDSPLKMVWQSRILTLSFKPAQGCEKYIPTISCFEM